MKNGQVPMTRVALTNENIQDFRSQIQTSFFFAADEESWPEEES